MIIRNKTINQGCYCADMFCKVYTTWTNRCYNIAIIAKSTALYRKPFKSQKGQSEYHAGNSIE